MLPLLVGGAAMLAGGLFKQGAVNRLESERRERLALVDADIMEARKTPQITTNTVDMQKMVADAEAAGFNPLTVLRAGGLGAYSVTRHPNLFPIRPLETAATGQSPFGDSLMGLGGMISSYDFGAAQRNALEAQLMKEQIANVSADTMARQSFRVPSVSYGGTPGGYSTVPGGAGAAAPVLGAPSYDRWTEEIPGITNPYGYDWMYMHPRWSDIGSGAEEAYGEIGGSTFFPFKLGADIGFTAAKHFEAVTGFNPRSIGPNIMDTLGTWWSQSGVGQAGGGAPPLSITVGGPNQTGL